MEVNTFDSEVPAAKVKNTFRELAMFLGFISLYFILQLWVLPSFGVQT